MDSLGNRTPGMSVTVACRQPYDFQLSRRAADSFGGASAHQPALKLGVRLDGVPALLEIKQAGRDSSLMYAGARPAPSSPASLERMAARVLNADLELEPFYAVAAGHPVLGPLTRSMRGLKAFRPSGLFEMLVIAVIEQQISLLAAHSIRSRVVARFGAEVEGEPVFPSPETLEAASLEQLTACGLSARKAEYVSGLAQAVVRGTFDLEALESAPSEEVRERITALRGFGLWSADYVLIRGLARPDAVPVDDLGIRTIVGRLLGDGSRASASETAALLAPFAPYRGVAAFYLLVAQRLV